MLKQRSMTFVKKSTQKYRETQRDNVQILGFLTKAVLKSVDKKLL